MRRQTNWQRKQYYNRYNLVNKNRYKEIDFFVSINDEKYN